MGLHSGFWDLLLRPSKAEALSDGGGEAFKSGIRPCFADPWRDVHRLTASKAQRFSFRPFIHTHALGLF